MCPEEFIDKAQKRFKIGEVYERKEIQSFMRVEHYGLQNPAALSYNRWNIGMSDICPLFELTGNGQYLYLGPKVSYTGETVNKSRYFPEVILIGTWNEGDFKFADPNIHSFQKWKESIKAQITDLGNRKRAYKEKIIDKKIESKNMKMPLKAQHITIPENQLGISYENLFKEYLLGAKHIILQDAYLRQEYQFENLLEFCMVLTNIKQKDQNLTLHIITYNEPEYLNITESNLVEFQRNLELEGINVSYEIERFHDRFIQTDTGWKILLGRGLDIFYKPDAKFHLGNKDQSRRRCKNCSITYLRNA